MSYKPKEPALDQRCAPSKTNNKSTGTCYDLESLQKMVKAYNEHYDRLVNKKSYPLGKITYTSEQFENKKYLLKELTDKLKKVCDNQLCWLKIDFIKQLNDEEILTNTFRPEGPSQEEKRYEWLSNFDIDQVMEQYEKYYKDFLYLDTAPIDFAMLKGKYNIADLDKAKLDNMKKDGINRLGVIFNLDKHTGPGTHWVALYINLAKKQIYFFDSYGIKPEKEIREFMARCANYMTGSNMTGGNKYNDKNCLYEKGSVDIRWNKTRHQRGGSECGVYSISFILRLLNGQEFDQINGNPVPDEKVNQCRKHYFTH
jgi:hypothetical protein